MDASLYIQRDIHVQELTIRVSRFLGTYQKGKDLQQPFCCMYGTKKE